MSGITVTDDGAAAALRQIGALGGDLESCLRYPAVGLPSAPIAQTARDELDEAWSTRRELELDGVEALELVVPAIVRAFDQADEQFQRALDELEIARRNSQGRN